MLREEVACGTPLGQLAQVSLDRGELVPDPLVLEMVERRVAQADCAHGFLFDGFPRTLVQAEKLDELLQRKAWRPLVVHFVVDRVQLFRRLTGRRVCKAGGEIYNIYDNPPKVAGYCDFDGGELVQRPDDMEAVIAERLETYDAQTRVLVDYYRARDVLVDVDGMAKPGEVAERVRRILANAR
jgi:adenylate kinase